MRRALVLLSLALAIGCDDPGGGPVDGGPPPSCEAPPALEQGAAEGHPEPLGAGPGQARAGRLRASDLPPDPRGMLAWEPGDFVLANDRVAFAVEDVGLSNDWNPHGGQPIGVARVEAGALIEPADYSELFFTLNRSTVAARSVGVLGDGSDGEPAVVRAIGPVEALGFLDFFEGVIPGEVSGIDAALDYVLAPDADAVEVRITLVNPSPDGVQIRSPLLFASQQNRMPKYAPRLGFDVGAGVPAPYFAFADDDATSFAFLSAGGDLRGLLEQSNLLLVQLPRYAADACGITERPLGRFVIGGPGLDPVIASADRALGEERVVVQGTVRQSDGAAAEGARVHARAADGAYLTRATTSADGGYRLHVPPGDVTLVAWRQGDAPSAERSVAAPASDADLTLGPTGAITVHVTDALGAPIPARVEAVPRDGDPFTAPADWGEHRVPRGAAGVVYSIDGEATMRLPAGRYTVVVSRGFEWEAVALDAEVTDGGASSLDAALDHVIDTPGVMCGDFHVHTHRSFDAEDDVELKVRAIVAAGLEIPTRSEHEWVTGFEPIIADLGVEEHAYGIASLELTTLLYGHFGVFPLDPDPAERNGGAVDWVRRDPPEVLADAHGRTGRFGRAEVMINHPRVGGALLGYFNAVGYDPATGMVSRPGMYFEDFSLLEVFNDSGFDENESGVVQDWFSLLNHGRRVFAVGSSDSHEVWRQPIGYPRTCVEVGVDTAAELRAIGAGRVTDRMVEGASTIVGGVYVEALARDGVGSGGAVTGAMARERVDVRVRAASWVPVDRLRVYVDGELRETLAIDASTEDPLDPTVRFEEAVEVDTSPGGWVAFVADGDGDLAPVHPGRRPFGVSNPIFFE